MSNTITAVTADQIITEVRRLAAEKPDFVYEKPEFSAFCLYMHGEEPGCIFGQALHNLGWDVTAPDAGTINTVLDDNDVHRTERQALWMREVQHEQDTRTPWGDAVAKADEEFPLV